MAFLNETFDANNVEPSAPIEILPPGKYTVQIVQSEMRETKNGAGQMLWLEMEIMDGPSRGRKLWDRLNLVNPNETAVEIARRTLSAICHATGQLQVSDSEQLHFKPMVATVKVRAAGNDKSGVWREAQNEVSGYGAISGAASATAGAAHAPATAAPRPAAPPPANRTPVGGGAPWRRSA